MLTQDSGGGRGIKTKLVTLATAVALSGAAVVVPFAAVADHTTAHTIQQLSAQITALQAQLAALSGGGSPSGGGAACTFTRSLTIGSRGTDVTCLQDYLTSTGHFTYAGGSTGYFGPVTRSSVSAWQAANNVSPTAGYFGPISRGKYNSLVAGGGTVPPPTGGAPVPPPPPPPPGDALPVPSPVAGTGLTVAAGDQPASALAPALAARVPATRVKFMAGTDGDVTVKSLTVERQGLADDSSIDAVLLLDEDGTQIGLNKTLNALHQVSLNESFTVKAGQTKTVTVAFNRPAAGSNAGQTVKFAVLAVDAGTATVSGSLPITGNSMTINESLSIGTLASPSRGTEDPGAARTSLEVGTKTFKATGARWTVGSAEPVMLEQIRFYQAGSAASGDLKNVQVWAKGAAYNTTVSSDGKYYTAMFKPAIEFDKGAVVDLTASADIEGGSDRTIDLDIQRRTDVVVKGKTFGYYIVAANGSSANTSTQGEGFTSTEPYYDAYAHTVSAGSLRFEKTNGVPSGNVPVDASNTKLGSFGLEAKGENVQVSSFKLSFTLSTGEAGTQVDNVAIYNKNDVVVAGPKDVGSDTTVTFSDTWTVPTGYNEYTVKGKLTTDFEEADTIQGSVDPDGDITAKGETTGLTITASPTSSTTLNTMTVRRASLAVTMGDSPSASNVVRGVNGFLFSKIQYDATASGEDLRITSQQLTFTTASGGDTDEVNNCVMFNGATALNTGGNVVNPGSDATAVNTAETETFTLDNNLFITRGTVGLIDVKCNVSSNFPANGTIRVGVANTTDDTVVVGKGTGASVTETITTNSGPIMTIRSVGTLAVELDASSPSERFGIAGKTDVIAAAFKLSTTYEDMKMQKFGFFLATTTASTSDVVKVTFWDGATKVGEGVFTSGTFVATSTFTTDFIVPKDGNKILTAKVDLISAASIGIKAAGGGTSGGNSGHLVVINYDGFRTGATEAIGQSSGSTVTTSTRSDTASRGMRIVKAYPTLERLSVPTNTLSAGVMVLYRFKVTAPADGDIALYRVTFNVSRPTNGATTSLFNLYGYTDSGFSTAAYAANPLNANDVDCVGSSSMEQGGNDTCSANNDQGAAGDEDRNKFMTVASSSDVSIFFDPLTNIASTPNSAAINIPSGATRYFELRATIVSTTTDTLSVALKGDASFRGLVQGDSLGIADTIATSSDFTWSPNTTTTAATSTNDWLNGFLIPGLPTTEMGAQTFSR